MAPSPAHAVAGDVVTGPTDMLESSSLKRHFRDGPLQGWIFPILIPRGTALQWEASIDSCEQKGTRENEAGAGERACPQSIGN